MTMAKERERKFLIADQKALDLHLSKGCVLFQRRIDQFYLITQEDRHLRIRREGNTLPGHTMCYKVKTTDPTVRDEFEMIISEEKFTEMSATAVSWLSKYRTSWHQELHSYVIYFDMDKIYVGEYPIEDVLEIEFPEDMPKDVEDKIVSDLKFLGKEVTSDPSYSNIVLAADNVRWWRDNRGVGPKESLSITIQ